MVGTRLGTRESIFRRSRGYKQENISGIFRKLGTRADVQAMVRAEARLLELARNSFDVAFKHKSAFRSRE